MKTLITSLFSGIVFGVGLSLSNMVNPDKVLDFLDVSGNWDPSLIFVLLAAWLVAAIAFRFILKRQSPVLADTFQVPTNKLVDRRLILGSALFGMGWGMTGFCPGPAVTSLALGSTEAVVVVISILLGFAFYHYWFERR